MPLNPSPRKIVPLSSGDDGPSRRPVPTLTKRAFFCGVVVEGPNDGADLSEDVQDLVASLGDKIPSAKDYDQPRVTPASSTQNEVQTRPRALTNTSALADLINELVVTERTYVQRLRMLKNSYADPLRSYAKSKDTAILGMYDSKTLFGNVDYLVPANEVFLHDLEQMISPKGAQTVGSVGDVALRHFKDLQTFDCYKQYYTGREEAQEIFKAEMSKKSSTGFAAFVERIKYSTNDVKNRVGLRELLMEPVQRIPRYTLLFQSMIKLMGANDPQRAKLIEAKELASRIAMAEADSHTRLAATLSCLATSIEGFPPALISSSRRFIDCIDVADNLAEAAGMNPYGSFSNIAGSSTPLNTSGSGGSLHCTLFLFDDKLMIVKRPGNDKPGRSLAGLDDVERVASSGLVSGKIRNMPSIKRSGMSFRGVVDITEVSATDVSATDMHLYLESPPMDQTDRWAGRPFRVLSAVIPGAANSDSMRLEDEKRRFMENLWRAQARYRTRMGQSVALRADEQEVESRGGRTTIARTYFNVYQRTMFLKEAKKTKVVLHVDSLGDADPLPFGIDNPPYVVIRVRPMPGELCRYSVHSCDPNEEPDEDIVQSSRVPSRVIQTIHQYGLFKFKTDNPSRPATPSGPNRSRAHIFGLDAISRNLFGSKAKESPSDSVGRHIRTKSALSRTSTLVTESSGTMTTADSSTRFSQRTYSTAATSVSSFAVEDNSLGKRNSKSRKLVRRSRSRSPATAHAGGSDPVPEDEPGNHSLSRRRARSLSVPRREDSIEYSDLEDVDTTILDTREKDDVTASEMDLSMRLDLARRNSQNQSGRKPSLDAIDVPLEDVIYEDEPPPPTASRTSRASHLSRTRCNSEHDARSLRSSSRHTARSITPTPVQEYGSPRKGRVDSFHSTRDRRPVGPRAPSPLPPTSPSIGAIELDIEGALESTLARMSPRRPSTPEDICLDDGGFDENEIISSSPIHEAPSRIPRSKRQPITPITSTNKGKHGKSASEALGIEPLTIKKKALSGTATPVSGARSSPSTTSTAGAEERTHSIRQRSDSCLSVSEQETSEEPVIMQEFVHLRKRTREDLESSHHAIKRIKLEVNALSSRVTQGSPRTADFRTTAHPALNPTSSRSSAPTKEAQQRMEEMRVMIDRRKGLATIPRTPRPKSIIEGAQGSSNVGSDAIEIQSWAKSVDSLVSSAENDLSQAIDGYTKVDHTIARIVEDRKQSNKDLDRTLFSLQRVNDQCQKLQKKLSNADAEIEAMYGEFNGELESLFKKVTMQKDEAWVAMCADLSETKMDRYRLRRENSDLEQRIREIETQRDQWAGLLRSHGLIP